MCLHKRLKKWGGAVNADPLMLSFFAAWDFSNCHLQKTSRLAETHCNVYKTLGIELHTIQQSDQYQAGLSSNQVREQEEMRGLRTKRGNWRRLVAPDIQPLFFTGVFTPSVF